MPKQALKKREVDFLDGSLFKNIVLFTLPVMATGVLQFLYNASDSAVVGSFISTDALGAVSSTGSLNNLMTGFFIGISVGASVAVSHALGSHDNEDAHEVVQTSVLLSFILGIFVAICGYFACTPLLRMMGTVDECLAQASRYMKIIFLGMPAQMLYNYGTSILRAKGDTRNPLIFLIISGAVNVVLNFFLVYFFRDVWGVAVATVFSQYLSAFLTIRLLGKIDGPCRLDILHLYIKPEKLLKILRIGLPAGIQSIVFSLSNVIIQSSINSFNSLAVVGGDGAAKNVDGLIYIAQNSFYHTAITFTGQNLGAKKLDRIRIICRDCVILVMVIGSLLGLGCYFFGPQLLSLFVKDDAETVKYAMIRLGIMGITYFICGIMEVMSGMLRGLGASLVSMIVSLLWACVFRIVWIMTVFRAIHTLEVLYLSYPLSWIMTSVTAFICYKIVLKRYIKLKPVSDA